MKTTITKKRIILVVLISAVSIVLTTAALATAPSGIISSTVQARAGFVDPVDIKFKVGQQQDVINVREAQQTVMQTIIIGPNGSTGWHSHPGPVVVLIKSGALTLYGGDDPQCTGRTYSAGQAFIDSGQGHVHIGRNESSSENVELWVTYFDVPAGAPFRIDAASPGNCSF